MPSIQGFEMKDGKMTPETVAKMEAAGTNMNPFGFRKPTEEESRSEKNEAEEVKKTEKKSGSKKK